MTGEKRNRKKLIFTPVVTFLMLALCIMLPGFSNGQVEAADFISRDIEVAVEYPSGGPDETFEIKVEAIDNAPLPNETVKTVHNGGRLVFGAFTYSVPGDYRYKVTHTKGSNPDITYDGSEFIVRFLVYRDSGDELRCITTVTKGDVESKPGSVTFKNSYKNAPEDPEKITATLPPIKKVVAGDRPESNRFIFTLARADESCPMPEAAGNRDSLTCTIRDVSTEKYGELGKVTFTEEGKYSYTVKEKDLGEPGYTYDTSEYELTYTVKKDADGKLSCTVDVLKDTFRADVDYIVFTNDFDKTGVNIDIIKEISVDPPVKKIIEGNPTGSTDFNFKLVADDPSFPMPEGSVDGIKNVTITNEGESDFGRYDYTEPGIYSYKVYEEHEGKDGYTYDTIVYFLVDTVTSDDRGSLSLSRLVTTSTGKEYTDVSYNDFIYTFVNKYNEGTQPPTAKKQQKNVDTGDRGNVLRLSIVAVAVSGAVIIAVVVFAKMKKRD